MVVERQKVVFILGAGVSSEAGIPGLTDFLPNLFSKVREYYREELRRTDSRDAQVILERITKVKNYMKANIGKCNVEEFLSFVDFMSTIKGKEGMQDRIIRQYLQTLIIKTILVNLNLHHTRDRDPYREFAQIIKGEKCPVITFNWDLLIDDYFGGNYNYGTDKIKGEDETVQIVPTDPPLLKLHGSMNWFIKDGQVFCKRNKLDTLLSSTEDASLERVIVMPTYMKFTPEKENNRRTDYYTFLGDIWKLALEEISEADHIFIIGFSFPETDQHFRLFLKHAFKKNMKKKAKPPEVYVVTRPKRLLQEKIDFEDRYTRILEDGMRLKPKFYYMGFSEFVIQVLTPAGAQCLSDSQVMKNLLYNLTQKST